MGRLLPRQFERVRRHRPDQWPGVYIETGLWRGNTLSAASGKFDEVHGIELAGHWYEHCRRRFADHPHVHIHHGDTQVLLAPLLEQFAERPVMLMLDAHFCRTDPPIPPTEFPLWAELEAAKARNQPDIVAVDDVHAFGRNRPAMARKGYGGWEDVTPESLLSFMEPVDSTVVGDTFFMWMGESA